MAVQLPDIPQVLPAQVETPKGFGRAHLDIWLPAGVLLFVVLACFVGPTLFNISSPVKAFLSSPRLPPLSRGHILGTDTFGYDELSRCLAGGRNSLIIGFGAAALGFLVGGTLGTVAGYFGGIHETVIMRLLDVLLAFPALVLAIAIATYLGPNQRNVIIAIAFFTIPAFARLSRATTLKVREHDYVIAGRLSGRPTRAMLARHIVPNIVPPLLTFALLSVAAAMLIEAALSYLGLGVPPPQPTWGGMIAAGQASWPNRSWMVVEPAIFLFVTILSLNRLGDVLRVRWATT